jgi:exodeoxyribonuclease V alpha subunit
MKDKKIHSMISNLKATGIFSEIDMHFARFILGFSGDPDADIFLAAALVSRATAGGDICLDLDAVTDGVLLKEQAGQVPLVCPPPVEWRQKLSAHPTVGHPGQRRPLILDNHNRLYLYRYWEYESLLSADMRERSDGELTDFNPGNVDTVLNRLFPNSAEGVDWQKVAAVTALLKRLCIITGGPGSWHAPGQTN